MFFVVSIELKTACDFHGHLYPDLVIGYRVCKLAEKILGEERMKHEGLVVVGSLPEDDRCEGQSASFSD